MALSRGHIFVGGGTHHLAFLRGPYKVPEPVRYVDSPPYSLRALPSGDLPFGPDHSIFLRHLQYSVPNPGLYPHPTTTHTTAMLFDSRHVMNDSQGMFHHGGDGTPGTGAAHVGKVDFDEPEVDSLTHGPGQGALFVAIQVGIPADNEFKFQHLQKGLPGPGYYLKPNVHGVLEFEAGDTGNVFRVEKAMPQVSFWFASKCITFDSDTDSLVMQPKSTTPGGNPNQMFEMTRDGSPPSHANVNSRKIYNLAFQAFSSTPKFWHVPDPAGTVVKLTSEIAQYSFEFEWIEVDNVPANLNRVLVKVGEKYLRVNNDALILDPVKAQATKFTCVVVNRPLVLLESHEQLLYTNQSSAMVFAHTQINKFAGNPRLNLYQTNPTFDRGYNLQRRWDYAFQGEFLNGFWKRTGNVATVNANNDDKGKFGMELYGNDHVVITCAEAEGEGEEQVQGFIARHPAGQSALQFENKATARGRMDGHTLLTCH